MPNVQAAIDAIPDIPANLPEVAEPAGRNISREVRDESKQVEESATEAPVEASGENPELAIAKFAKEASEAEASAAKEESTKLAELKRLELQERIEALKAKRTQSREAQRLAAEKSALEQARAEAQRLREEAIAERTRWERARRNPVQAFKELGLDPVSAYDEITRAATEFDTPEAREAAKFEQFKKQLLEELSPRLTKAEQLEKELSEFRERERMRDEHFAIQAQIAAEQQFLEIVKQDGYGVVADYYDDPEEMLTVANAVAADFAQQGRQFKVKDVADFLRDALDAKVKRVLSKRQQSSASTESAGQAASVNSSGSSSAPVSKEKANTVTGAMASSTASTTGKKLSRAERQRLAELEIEKMERAGHF